MTKTLAPMGLFAGLMLLAACSTPQEAAREHVRRGDRYLAEKKVAEAVLQYRNAVERDPDSGEARKKLADLYARSGNLKAALSQYVRAADLLPDDAEAQLSAGTLLLATRQFEDAGQRAEKILARDPGNVNAHVLKANALAGLRDLNAAITELEEAISLDRERTTTYANLGAFEAARGRHHEAEAAYLKAITVAPNSVAPRLAIANYYWATGRMKEVEENLNAALRIDPKNVAAHRAMGMFHVVSGNPRDAETHLKAVAEGSEEAAPRLTLADFYLSQSRPNDATPLLEELAKRPASFAAATARLAAVVYGRGDREKAHAMLDSVLAKEPSNVQVMFLKGSWQLSEGRVDDARKTADAALKAGPESVQAHQLAGTIYASKGQVEEAIAEFQEVVKLNPKAAAAQLQLARLHELTGGHQQARQHAQDAVKLAPRSGAARSALVRSLIGTGDLAAADRELEPLLRAARDTYEVQLLVGRIALGRRDYAGAQSAFERAVAADAAGIEALAALAVLDAGNNRLPRARDRVATALKKKPSDPALLVLSARLDAAAGELSAAEQTLRRVIDASPDYLAAYETLGRLYVRQKNLDAALHEYELLTARRPRAVGPPTMVAMLHQARGRSHEARAAYQRVLEIDSRAVVANNNLAYMYAEEEKELDVALQMAQAAKAARPDDPDVNDTLGWVFYKKGMPAQAVGPLLQSIRTQPANPLYHYHLGLVYLRAGDRDKAKASLERALSLGYFPEAAAARKALEGIR